MPYGAKKRGNAQCPYCGSLERHRFLQRLITKYALNENHREMTVLHFSPEECIRKYFQREDVDYWPVDIDPDFKGIRKQFDITKIDFENDLFDVIVCIHVLERVEDDVCAMKELYRVLKKEVQCL